MNKKYKTEGVQQLGKEVVGMMEKFERKSLKEKYANVINAVNTKKETLDDDADLYTDIMADFIELAYEPKLIAEGIIKQINLPMYAGADSIKIPIESRLTSDDVSADGSVTERDTGYTEITIEPDWKGLKTTISEKLLRKGAVDLIGHRLGQIGRAISRGVDEDILEEMGKACTKDDATYGDNSNYNYLTTSSHMSFDAVIDSIAEHRKLYAEPTWLIISPTQWNHLMKDSDMKSAQAYGTTTGNVYEIQQFGALRIFVSNNLDDDGPDAMLVDSEEVGYFVDQTDIETWDGRPVGKIATEVIGAKCYGVGIAKPTAVFGIFADTDEPT